jgi:hypothetical protein
MKVRITLTPGVFFLWCLFEATAYSWSVNPLTGSSQNHFCCFPPRPFLWFYSIRLETAGLYVSVSLIIITGSSRIQAVLQKVKWPDGNICLWLFSAITSEDQRDHATAWVTGNNVKICQRTAAIMFKSFTDHYETIINVQSELRNGGHVLQMLQKSKIHKLCIRGGNIQQWNSGSSRTDHEHK